MSRPAVDLRRALTGGLLFSDGGVGSSLLGLGLDRERDFAGFEGCCEVLNVERPDVVRSLHAGFLAAGCDAITTNSFCGDGPTLARRGLAARASELALAAASLARAAADEAARDGRARYVLGSLGPGFAREGELHEPGGALECGYRELALALLAGGVDGLLVETVRDLARARAALAGARAALEHAASPAALLLSFAPLAGGTLAGGVALAAAMEELGRFDLDLVAVNCVPPGQPARAALADLAACGVAALGVWPNAGIPAAGTQPPAWPLGPRPFAAQLARLAELFDLRLVGGCCGTTPAHLRAAIEALRP